MSRKGNKVFVSYARANFSAVDPAVTLLKALGLQTFFDSDEPLSDALTPEIRSEIDNSDYFLLFWSLQASRSNWVRRELKHALSRGGKTRILLTVIDDSRPPEELDQSNIRVRLNDTNGARRDRDERASRFKLHAMRLAAAWEAHVVVANWTVEDGNRALLTAFVEQADLLEKAVRNDYGITIQGSPASYSGTQIADGQIRITSGPFGIAERSDQPEGIPVRRTPGSRKPQSGKYGKRRLGYATAPSVGFPSADLGGTVT